MNNFYPRLRSPQFKPLKAQYKQQVRCPTYLDELGIAKNYSFESLVNLTSVKDSEPFDECKFYALDYQACNKSDEEYFSCLSELEKVTFLYYCRLNNY